MAKLKEHWNKLRHFLSREVWEIDPRGLRRGKLFLLHQAQLITLVLKDFMADRCLLRASALTYTTLLSIVPLLALMFSVLKGLGVQNTLEPLLLKELAVGSQAIVDNIITYINNTNVGRLGTVGLLALILTVLALLSNIEESFNYIWGVKETRSLMRRFADYFSVVILGPVFLLAAISMTATVQAQSFVQHLLEMAYVGQLILFLFKVLPYVAMWAGFTFLYIFMPNIKVQMKAALIGGVVGGTLWQLGQWIYVAGQLGVARYNAIYGTMAALPIFMVWIYLSWVIVLMGLEVAYASQNLRTIRQEYSGGEVNFASRERVALIVMVVVTRAFLDGERAWSGERIGDELELPPRLAHSVLNDLVRLGLLSRTEGAEETGYQPGRAPERLKVLEVVQALRHDGMDYQHLGACPERSAIEDLVKKMDQALAGELEELTVRDLAAAGPQREEGSKTEAQ